MSFVKGIELCRRFHMEIIEPFMMDQYPLLSYSSALMGPGSEVLGYDTEMSTDHDWVPRVYLFLNHSDFGYSDQIQSTLRERAPERFYGFPVDIEKTVITTVPMFIESYLAVNQDAQLELVDWLTFPSQSLLEITRGEVYRDDHGQLSALRKQFEYYPSDIWLYLMGSCWQRIGQEEHLMLRSGYIGDELGSAIIASRLVRDIINLCFLMERQYAPYPKWLGTAFNNLNCSNSLMPHLWTAQTAATWREREHALNQAYTHLSRMHNALGITEEIPEGVTSFFDRPFKVMNGEAIASLIANQIVDPDIQRLSKKRLIGNIDLITDNTDFRKMSRWSESRGESARTTFKNLFKD
ncbi:DUF4037 domain-containing protein [Paenibacillus glycanilyticus]|uniref:DUF4037 domain-containing protein n=1 Tax=Paenibacillus glycanilyticus TaxID=126569 RepID=A0ABQ6GMQ3_9BACL|nr:DUF4037 domain-containing protein [Paenibacillus glycanilyticus]GLX70668.1 hypothetical protein MU1_50140 [Paenibacillus glycanilyticus]